MTDVQGAALDDLIAVVRDRRDLYAAMRAAVELGRRRASEAVPVLIDALGAGDEWLATDGAEALGRIGDARAVPALLSALRSDFGEALAAEIVAREHAISNENAAHAAVAAAQVLTDQEALQRAAARALGAIGGVQAEAGLRAVMAELEAGGGGRFTRDTLIEAIRAALESPVPLAQLEHHLAPAPAAATIPSVLDRLPGWVVDDDTSVRQEVCEWVGLTPAQLWRLAVLCSRDAMWAVRAGADPQRALDWVDPLPPSTVAALDRLRRAAGWGDDHR